METKWFNFTIIHTETDVYDCVVRAKDKEDALEQIRNNNFDVYNEHEIDGEYDFDSIEFGDESYD